MGKCWTNNLAIGHKAKNVFIFTFEIFLFVPFYVRNDTCYQILDLLGQVMVIMAKYLDLISTMLISLKTTAFMLSFGH